MSRWVPHRGQICDFPGIYAIVLDGKVAYIGQSMNVGRRLSAHALPACASKGMYRGVRFSELRVKVREVKDGECRLRIESALIRKINPEVNISGAIKPEREVRELPSREGDTYVHTMHLEYG